VARVDIVKTSDPAVNMEIVRNMVAKVVGMTIMSADLANSMIADMVNKERCVLAIMAMIAINKTIEVEAAGATSIAIQ
jgi:hypothetical protein